MSATAPPVKFSYLPDAYMTRRAPRSHTMAIAEFANFLAKPVRASKAELPWVNMATYATLRSPTYTDRNGVKRGGSFRHDANVTEITGGIADYDTGAGSANPTAAPMAIVQAAALLSEADILAVLYETPSSTPAKPRWRVIAPAANIVTDPAQLRQARRDFFHRIDHVLGHICDRCSIDLSRAFYFGSIFPGFPPIPVEVTTGTRTIDQAIELGYAPVEQLSGLPRSPGGQAHPEPAEDPPGAADAAMRWLADNCRRDDLSRWLIAATLVADFGLTDDTATRLWVRSGLRTESDRPNGREELQDKLDHARRYAKRQFGQGSARRYLGNI